jgi:hypothetical protein
LDDFGELSWLVYRANKFGLFARTAPTKKGKTIEASMEAAYEQLNKSLSD